MKYSLRTLLIVAILGPSVLAAGYFLSDTLRQSVRQMVDFEQEHKRHNHPDNPIRALLPTLLD